MGCGARCIDRRRWDSWQAAGQLGSFTGRVQGIGGTGCHRPIRIGLSKRGVSLSDAALPLLVAPVAHGFGDGRGAVATRLVKKLEQLLVKGDRDLAPPAMAQLI